MVHGLINAEIANTLGEKVLEAHEAAVAALRNDWNATFMETADTQRAEATSWQTERSGATIAAS